jgi:integrase
MNTEFTVGTLIRRYLAEVTGIGPTKLSVLTRIAGMPIASKDARKLRAADYIEHCRLRRKTVKPSTVALDLTHWNTVMVYARVAWDMSDVSRASLIDAKPVLRQQRLIGSSPHRDRRPSADELQRLLAHFRTSKGTIPMADIVELSVEFGRRISETCRMKWGDYDPVRRTIRLRDLKHSKRKDGNDKEAAIPDRANEIILRQPRRTTDPDERIFPCNHRSAIAAYCIAKNKLGIKGLHLHDNRGECSTRLLEQGYSVPQVMLVTLHDDPKMLLTKYNKLRPDNFHTGPAGKLA